MLNIKINLNNMNTNEDYQYKKRFYRNKNDNKNINIENVIRARLNHQSTIKELENKFSLKDSSFANLTTFSFLIKYNSWDELKKRDFIRTIGGIYAWQTKNYLNNLLQTYQKSSNSVSIKVHKHVLV